MSWISKEHKKLYSNAFSALYEDVKTASGSLMDTTGKLLTTGYEKVKETAEYVDKKIHNNDSNENIDSDNIEGDNDDTDVFGESDDTDDYLVQMGKIYPDVLIKLNRKNNNLSKIWVIDNEGNKKRITGKIASYDYINTIIHRWFRYEKKLDSNSIDGNSIDGNKSNDNNSNATNATNATNGTNATYKWYPTEELYTAYRQTTPRMLNPIDNILFRYTRDDYQPHYYHPLI